MLAMYHERDAYTAAARNTNQAPIQSDIKSAGSLREPACARAEAKEIAKSGAEKLQNGGRQADNSELTTQTRVMRTMFEYAFSEKLLLNQIRQLVRWSANTCAPLPTLTLKDSTFRNDAVHSPKNPSLSKQRHTAQ